MHPNYFDKYSYKCGYNIFSIFCLLGLSLTRVVHFFGLKIPFVIITSCVFILDVILRRLPLYMYNELKYHIEFIIFKINLKKLLLNDEIQILINDKNCLDINLISKKNLFKDQTMYEDMKIVFEIIKKSRNHELDILDDKNFMKLYYDFDLIIPKNLNDNNKFLIDNYLYHINRILSVDFVKYISSNNIKISEDEFNAMTTPIGENVNFCDKDGNHNIRIGQIESDNDDKYYLIVNPGCVEKFLGHVYYSKNYYLKNKENVKKLDKQLDKEYDYFNLKNINEQSNSSNSESNTSRNGRSNGESNSSENKSFKFKIKKTHVKLLNKYIYYHFILSKLYENNTLECKNYERKLYLNNGSDGLKKISGTNVKFEFVIGNFENIEIKVIEQPSLTFWYNYSSFI